MRRYLKRKAVDRQRTDAEDTLFKRIANQIHTPDDLKRALDGIDEQQQLLLVRRLTPYLMFDVQFFVDQNKD